MKSPTQITPIGLLGDDQGRRINLRDFALPTLTRTGSHPPTTIAVVGTGMDSGKTQTCAHLVRGLIAAGLRVAYIKITGTGAGGDTWLLTDAGASPVLDFTDAGMSTTYLAPISQIESALVSLLAHAANEGVDAAVVEVADGVLQIETSALLKSEIFASLVSGLMMVSHDSMGASAGVHWLMKNSRPPVLALSGIISTSPLQAREATQALGLPVYDRTDLASEFECAACAPVSGIVDRVCGIKTETQDALSDRRDGALAQGIDVTLEPDVKAQIITARPHVDIGCCRHVFVETLCCRETRDGICDGIGWIERVSVICERSDFCASASEVRTFVSDGAGERESVCFACHGRLLSVVIPEPLGRYAVLFSMYELYRSLELNVGFAKNSWSWW
jgi:molybdopterin-guanine dinucleotide biosynthesis protein